MRTLLPGLLIAVALVALVVQLTLPRLVARRVEERLAEGGGAADVVIAALPVLTLIAGRGDSIEARGAGLRFDLDDRGERPFRRLDGFARVDLLFIDSEAGPFQVEELSLSRERRDAYYELRLKASVAPVELADRVGAATGPLGSLVGSLATGLVPGAGRVAVPVRVEAKVKSRDGVPDVTSARGRVAGVPSGALAEGVLGAVLPRL